MAILEFHQIQGQKRMPSKMTKFRGCIDIHSGQVKQIVGGTLSQDDNTSLHDKNLSTNFVSTKPASYYGTLYKNNQVYGTHVIKLGSSDANNKAALDALQSWPNHMQIGGGINIDNAQEWLDAGADKVIVTSWLFSNGEFDFELLKKLSQRIGKQNLVVDLSCRKVVESDETKWCVAINKWQTLTSTYLDAQFLSKVAEYCSEFLVHAADVEGLCKGIEDELVVALGEWFNGTPITYAGGAKSITDLEKVNQLSQGHVDLTFGSALDIFGGKLVKFRDCCAWNNK